MIWDDAEAAMTFQGITLFKGMKLDGVSVLSFDIEADGLVQHENSHVFVITNTFSKNGKQITKQFRADHYENEGLMIDEWCDWVREVNPDILTGHNIFGFDFLQLNHVASLHGTKLYLGRDGSEIKVPKKSRNYRVDGSQTWEYINYRIFGRNIIDGMFLAVKYDIGRNYASWGLKSIIDHEGLVSDGRQFYDASKIGKDWWDLEKRELIVDYCVDDGNDSLSIFNLMVPSFFYMTQSIRKPFQTIINGASGSWLNNILVSAYLQELHSIPKANEPSPVAGGISFVNSQVHKNVFKIDIISMYPSIMRQFKCYPLQKDPKKYFVKMVDYFTEERFKNKRLYKETKNKYYDDMQASLKIGINSSYGMTSTRGLNFNDFSMGDFVTGVGRQIIKLSLEWATGKDITYWWQDYALDKDKKYNVVLSKYKTYEDFIKGENL